MFKYVELDLRLSEIAKPQGLLGPAEIANETKEKDS